MPRQLDAQIPAATRTIACRVTPELHRQVEEAAAATGRDISSYLRDTLFAETELTLDALEQVRHEVTTTAEAQARIERAAYEAGLEQSGRDAARWRRRAAELKQDARITSERLLLVVSRVLMGDPGAPAECLRLWRYLAHEDQVRMLIPVAIAVTERLDKLRIEIVPRAYQLRSAMAIYSNANWIIGSVILSPNKEPLASDVVAAQTVVVMALVQAFSALGQAIHVAGSGPLPKPAGSARAADSSRVEPLDGDTHQLKTATNAPDGMATRDDDDPVVAYTSQDLWEVEHAPAGYAVVKPGVYRQLTDDGESRPDRPRDF